MRSCTSTFFPFEKRLDWDFFILQSFHIPVKALDKWRETIIDRRLTNVSGGISETRSTGDNSVALRCAWRNSFPFIMHRRAFHSTPWQFSGFVPFSELARGLALKLNYRALAGPGSVVILLFAAKLHFPRANVPPCNLLTFPAIRLPSARMKIKKNEKVFDNHQAPLNAIKKLS